MAGPSDELFEPMSVDQPIRLVARNFFALGSGEILARMVAFAATIYLARTLGPSGYGIIGFATAVLLYLARVADFGIELIGAREIAKDRSHLHRLAPALLSYRLLLAAGLLIVTCAVGLFLPYPDGLILIIYSLTLLAVAAGTRWIFVGLENATPVAVARTVGELVMLVSILLFIDGPRDLLRVPAAQVAGDTLAALLLALWLYRRGHALPLRFDWTAVRPLLSRASPLVLSALLGLVIFNSGLILLRFFQGAVTVGYFAAAYALVSLLLNLGLSYRMSLLPTFTRLAGTHEHRHALYDTAMVQVFAVALPIAVGGSLLAPQLVQVVFGDRYASSVPALQLLIWSVPLCVLRDVPSAALLANAREDLFFRLTAWGAALNLLLNLALIPRYGMIGAGIATVVTEAVRLVIAISYVRAEGFRLAELGLLGRVSCATLVMTALLLVVRPAAVGFAVALGVFVYAAALVGVRAIRLTRGGVPALNLRRKAQPLTSG